MTPPFAGGTPAPAMHLSRACGRQPARLHASGRHEAAPGRTSSLPSSAAQPPYLRRLRGRSHATAHKDTLEGHPSSNNRPSSSSSSSSSSCSSACGSEEQVATQPPVAIAVVGGGLAGVAAAWQLAVSHQKAMRVYNDSFERISQHALAGHSARAAWRLRCGLSKGTRRAHAAPARQLTKLRSVTPRACVFRVLVVCVFRRTRPCPAHPAARSAPRHGAAPCGWTCGRRRAWRRAAAAPQQGCCTPTRRGARRVVLGMRSIQGMSIMHSINVG